MAVGTRVDAVTKTEIIEKVVEVAPSKIVLELTEREALVLNVLTAYTKDTDPRFPEIRSIRRALYDADVPDYWNKVHLNFKVKDESGEPGLITLCEGAPSYRAGIY